MHIVILVFGNSYGWWVEELKVYCSYPTSLKRTMSVENMYHGVRLCL